MSKEQFAAHDILKIKSGFYARFNFCLMISA
jgi:hypothetical protein